MCRACGRRAPAVPIRCSSPAAVRTWTPPTTTRTASNFSRTVCPVTSADGNNHNRVLDPLSARYATIAHGANALTYGASTLGGAIDFTSPTARNSAPLSLFASGGSNGQLERARHRRNGGGSVRRPHHARDQELGRLSRAQRAGWRGRLSQRRLAVVGCGDHAGCTPPGWTTKKKLPGALTRAQFEEDPDQASAPALNADYGKKVETGRIAAKTTWNLGDRSSIDVGLSYEKQSLYHPIVDRIMVDFDGAGTGAAGGSLQPAGRHRSSRCRRHGALPASGRRSQPARRDQFR